MSAIFLSHSSKDNAVTAEISAHLRAAGHTSLFLDFDPADGIPAGRHWEQELYDRLRGCRAVIVLCSPASMESDWCFAEITHAKSLGKKIFPVKIAACEVRSVLSNLQIIDMTADRQTALAQLTKDLITAGLDPRDMFQWDGKRPLYPGLLAFQENDAALFFGRETEVQEGLDLITRLATFGGARLMMVLGASGSGKSSLVRAGVLPRLKRDPERWLVAPPFRPFNDPLREMAMSLADLFTQIDAPRNWRAVHEMLTAATSPAAFADTLFDIVQDLRHLSNRRDAKLILTVDQFEELLGTKSGDGAQARITAFRERLEAVLGHPQMPVLAIGTLRSDFLGQFQTDAGLAKLDYEPLTIGPMTQDGYAALIEGPATIGGVELERGLVQRILSDTGANDALPLLAFTLRALWENYGDDNLLTIAEYEAIGGLEGSVAKAAEGVMAAVPLSQAEMTDLRTAFTSMTRINEGGQFSRRPTLWGDLPQRAQPLGERFVDARLLVSMQEEDHRILEVSHEALFRTWTQLRLWLEEDRENIRLRDSLHLAATEWDAQDRDAQMLVHRGGRLETAETLLRQPRFEIDSLSRDYVEACLTERARVQAAERAAEEAKRRRLRVTVAALAIGLVVAIGGVGVALYQTQIAEQQAQLAQEQAQVAAENLTRFEAEQEQRVEAQNQRITQALQSGWRALAGLSEVTDDENYENCGTIKGLAGVRAIYCAVSNVTSLQTLATLSGVPLFTSGPHSVVEDGTESYEYDLRSNQIGHYNPAFLDWLKAYAARAYDNPRFLRDTQDVFDEHVRASAQIYFETYLELFAPSKRAEREQITARFKDNLADYTEEDEFFRRNPPNSDWQATWYSSPSYKLGEDLFVLMGHLGLDDRPSGAYDRQVAMSFWVRRSIDGTHRAFFDVLLGLLDAYDARSIGDLPALADDL